MEHWNMEHWNMPKGRCVRRVTGVCAWWLWGEAPTSKLSRASSKRFDFTIVPVHISLACGVLPLPSQFVCSAWGGLAGVVNVWDSTVCSSCMSQWAKPVLWKKLVQTALYIIIYFVFLCRFLPISFGKLYANCNISSKAVSFSNTKKKLEH